MGRRELRKCEVGWRREAPEVKEHGGELMLEQRRDFPGGPATKAPGAQCGRPRFSPWSGS